MAKKSQNQPKKKSQKVNSINLLKGKILYDNVLLKPIVLANDGIVLKPQQYEDKPEWGEVIACGDGRLFENGELRELQISPGDLVLFQKYSAQKFRHAGEDYLIIREEDIFFVNRKR